jgi:hypothetical protein
MQNNKQQRFYLFSSAFVRAYWQTVKSGIFPMPGDEPVRETVEELISSVSQETEIKQPWFGSGTLYKLRMTHACGAWWLFSFSEGRRGWVLAGCSARSDDDRKPHDLLGPVYRSYFDPFLRHVTEVANAQEGI